MNSPRSIDPQTAGRKTLSQGFSTWIAGRGVLLEGHADCGSLQTQIWYIPEGLTLSPPKWARIASAPSRETLFAKRLSVGMAGALSHTVGQACRTAVQAPHDLTDQPVANEIPAGLCYQRLSSDDEGGSFCLHGLTAVLLGDRGWYRVDPRGNKEGVDAQFTPPVEQLAFAVQHAGEADLPEIWAEPLPVVVAALRSHDTYDALAHALPDVPQFGSYSVGDTWRRPPLHGDPSAENAPPSHVS